MRPALHQHAARSLEHRGNGRLVVAPENCGQPVSDDSVLDDGLDRLDGRHRVEMRAEKQRLSGHDGRERDEDVPHRRTDRFPGLVLLGLDSQVAQIAEHAVGDGPLLARRARNGGELEEEIEGLRCHGRPW
jgi:hypothetical protein